jgi:hypothetical protein
VYIVPSKETYDPKIWEILRANKYTTKDGVHTDEQRSKPLCCLAVTEDGHECLTKLGKSAHRESHKKPIEEKFTGSWIKANGEIPKNSKHKRREQDEGDFYQQKAEVDCFVVVH